MPSGEPAAKEDFIPLLGGEYPDLPDLNLSRIYRSNGFLAS
jgi:hypothetical protein